MDASKVAQTTLPFEPFVILTPRLLVLPTPHAISSRYYRSLYASLHADKAFCEMAFGDHFSPVQWSDEKTHDAIQRGDINVCWKLRGMGDFAVGLRPPEIFTESSSAVEILEGDALKGIPCLDLQNLDEITWVGYAGVRDATTTSMPPREAGDPPLPPWTEMAEIRYGVAPTYWGKGIAKEAAEAVMHWAANARGVTRFIAETERPNKRSARALEKLGFTLSGTNYWKEPSEIEWEKVLVQ